MTGKDFLIGMSFVDDRFMQEALIERNKKQHIPTWSKICAVAACMALVAVSVFTLHQNTSVTPNPSITDQLTENPDITEPINEPQTNSTIDQSFEKNIVSLNGISINELVNIASAAPMYYSPDEYDTAQWGPEEVAAYYGSNLTPAYIPVGLFASPSNGYADIVATKNGTIVADTVWMQYYHAYGDDGYPILTEQVLARKGFVLKAAKVGVLSDCVYILPEGEVKVSQIGNVDVIFGHRQMPYGPYDAQTNKPAGYYELYTAEFDIVGVRYQGVFEQMELADVVQVITSFISSQHT